VTAFPSATPEEQAAFQGTRPPAKQVCRCSSASGLDIFQRLFLLKQAAKLNELSQPATKPAEKDVTPLERAAEIKATYLVCNKAEGKD